MAGTLLGLGGVAFLASWGLGEVAAACRAEARSLQRDLEGAVQPANMASAFRAVAGAAAAASDCCCRRPAAPDRVVCRPVDACPGGAHPGGPAGTRAGREADHGSALGARGGVCTGRRPPTASSTAAATPGWFTGC